MRMTIHILAAVIFILIVSRAWCDIHGWIDKNGIRHFSNTGPPYGQRTTRIPESIRSAIDKSSKRANFKVIKVVDGDTVQVQGQGLEFRIRMVAIDAPETGGRKKRGQPYSQKAKKALKQLVQGKKVRLKQYGTGGYNRILAEIFSRDLNINLEMVRLGFAEVYRGKLPDTLDAGSYKNAEADARRRRVGMWAQGKWYKSPKKWRRENPW